MINFKTVFVLLMSLFTFSAIADSNIVNVYGIPFGKTIDVSKHNLEYDKKHNVYKLKNVSENLIKNVQYKLDDKESVTQIIVRFNDVKINEGDSMIRIITDELVKKYHTKSKSQNNRFNEIKLKNGYINIIGSYDEKYMMIAVTYNLYKKTEIENLVKSKL